MPMMGASGAGGDVMQSLAGVHDLYSLLKLIEDPKRYKAAIEEMAKLVNEIKVKKQIKDIEGAQIALKAKLEQAGQALDKAQAEATEIVNGARAQANQAIHDAEQTAANISASARQAGMIANEKLTQAKQLEQAAKSAQAATEGARRAAETAQRDAESIRTDLHNRLQAIQAAAGRL